MLVLSISRVWVKLGVRVLSEFEALGFIPRSTTSKHISDFQSPISHDSPLSLRILITIENDSVGGRKIAWR